LNNFIIILTVILFISVYGLDSFAEESQTIVDLQANATKMIDESNFENALVYLDEILEIDPKNINALNHKGGVLLSLKNYSNAITYFDHVLEINENNTQALNNKAISLYKQELYISSLRIFYKSLLTDPTNQNTINNTKNVVDKLYWLDETKDSLGTITVRDKNGNLISHSKIIKIQIQPPLGYILLEKIGNVKEVEIDGKTKQVFEYFGYIDLNKNQYIGNGVLSLKVGGFHMDVLQMIFNGLIAEREDKIIYQLIIPVPFYWYL